MVGMLGCGHSAAAGVLARFGPTAVLVLMLAGVAVTGASAAFLERGAPLLGTASIAVHDNVTAHFFNPALVGWQPGSGLFGWVEKQESGPWACSMAARWARVSVGYAWRDASRDPIPPPLSTRGASVETGEAGQLAARKELSFCLGSRRFPGTRGFYLGTRFRRAWGQDGAAWRWDEGIVLRRTPSISVAAVAQDLAQDRLDGVLLRRSYRIGLAVRPLQSESRSRLTLFGEIWGGEKQSWNDEAFWSVGILGRPRRVCELSLTVEGRTGTGIKDLTAAGGVTFMLGRGRFMAVVREGEIGGRQRPFCGLGALEERRQGFGVRQGRR